MKIASINPLSHEGYDLLHKGILALARAEEQGMRIDMEYARMKSARLEKQIQILTKQIHGTKFYRHWDKATSKKTNINSPQQLAYFLYRVKKLKPPKLTKTKQGSTDDETLKALNLPELDLLLRIRKLKKLKDTYLGAFIREQVNGYIHPFFNLHTVITYRSSSDQPNFQNLPSRDKESMQTIRRAIFPRPGHQFLEIDFSSLEVRIAACYHKDSNMLEYLKSGHDFHADIAVQIFKLGEYMEDIKGHETLRKGTKNGFVFPQFYGDYYKNNALDLCKWGQLPKEGKWTSNSGIEVGDVNLAEHLKSQGIPSYKSFENHLKDIEEHLWKVRFKDYAWWRDTIWETYQKYGYIDLKTGFRCSGIMTRNEVTNYPIQGSAFHSLLWSLITLDDIMRRERWDTRIVAQIHDSIILDVNPNELKRVSEVANRVTSQDLANAWKWIITPLSVDADLAPVDASLADTEKVKLI